MAEGARAHRFTVTMEVETFSEGDVSPDEVEEQLDGETFGDFTVVGVSWVEPKEA